MRNLFFLSLTCFLVIPVLAQDPIRGPHDPDDPDGFPISGGMLAWGTTLHGGRAGVTTETEFINIINNGSFGAPLNGPGFGAASGNICVNVYAFSPDEQLVSCCSCLITPNGLISLAVDSDLLSNTLTGIRPSSVTVKLISSLAGTGGTGSSCTNSAALVQKNLNSPFPLAVRGINAWGVKLLTTPVVNSFAVGEVPFSLATLSFTDLASITNRCANIIGNGSSFGICRSCRAGGLTPSTN